MNLVRSSAYTGVATLAKLLAALVVIKLVAVFAGPQGVGRLGQFLALMSVLAVLAGGGISTGIVKYVAQYRSDALALQRLLSAALGYACSAACVMAVLALVFSDVLAERLLGDAQARWLICVLAVAQIGIALVNYILAIINGFMDVRRLAIVQVSGAVLSVALVAWLGSGWQLQGALLALVLGQVLWLIAAVPALLRSPYFQREMLRMRLDAQMTRQLAAFSVMTLTATLVPQLVGMLVRDHLALQFGWQQVGYWQAVSRVSDAYLLFFTTAINVYYLPKLASLQDRQALRRELRTAYRYVMPAVVAMAACVYLLRDWVTWLLFDARFAAAAPLYGPQVLGDVIKIAAFVLSYVMLAKAMTRLFVVSECVFAASYLGLVYLFTTQFGLIGAMYAFVVNYVLYLLFNIVVVRRYLRATA
ncbi:O-antigen translocase [Xanthomonas campestris pv. campestris]|uniref:O-antigen translocase n=1 Tax=Xanthomonas campestris TaxID=339 RepID=UPI0022698A18|nr:O-antigen translocase [Xanthomonas campestris]MDO0788039.1 O-antigen translocase [Xanthomonas campestris pv. campestris]MDO0837446.1 O-antigen translocase [Xanthomonas campestris pv. campestris]MEB1347684.1 O-antigen translocase [Xanthomonas campestris pv. campestris]WDK51211.1 O-antigen translocase [Xanthomonas campestris pv. campestris]WDK52543.1 O-antigen translocase [Xanthomonas campestris pv. campestris]